MIDVQTFQTLLLVVCILAFFGAVFAGYVIESGKPWVRILIKAFFAVLAVTSGFAGIMLLILK